MKRTCYAIGLIALVGLSSCKNNSNNQSAPEVATEETIAQTSQGINIPKTPGALSEENAWDKYAKTPKLAAEEQQIYKIADIKHPEFLDLKKDGYVAKAKDVYKDDNGCLVTLLVIVRDHMMKEFLVSYNAQGEYVDCVEIGLMGADQITGKIEGDSVISKLSWCDMGVECTDEFIQYKITPEFKFQKEKEWKEVIKE